VARTLLASDPTTVVVMTIPYDATSLLRTDGEAFIEIMTTHDLAHEVPACPGWSLGDLAWHLGEVWHRWGTFVAEGVTSIEQVRDAARPERPDDNELVEWISVSHNALYSALVRARPDQEVWTWTGANRDVEWVRRRMALETAVHRWDAASAVGLPYEVPADVAADGIDEFLMWFAGRRVSPDAAQVSGTVHLHCTDTDSGAAGEWLVTSLDVAGAEFTREHAKGDAAIRGRAHDVLLWVWRRDGGPVEILGDADVAQRFREYSAL
jgi:uncharacterized protein (TIGR03083 family)